MGIHDIARMERKDDDGGSALPTEIKAKFGELMAAVTEIKNKANDTDKNLKDVVRQDELGKINTSVEELKSTINAEIAALKRTPRGDDKKSVSPELAAYSTGFEDYFRKGDHKINEHALRDLEAKALSGTVGNDASGGFTVRPEMDSAIEQTVKEVSPIRAIASVRTISTGTLERLANKHGVNSGWVGETSARPQTLAPDLEKMIFPVMELYAMPAASQTLLDDSAVNIDQWMGDEVALEFAQQEGAAFVAGAGPNKPRGFTSYDKVANASYTWGKTGYLFTGEAAAFATSNPDNVLIDALVALAPAYRGNATWVMNRSTIGTIRKWKASGVGIPLIEYSLRNEGLVETLLGRPVVDAPDMQSLGAGTYPIALGDFKRGYVIVDRQGIRVLRDPYTAKPFVLFYTTKRVGGGIQNFEAIKLIKCATS